MWILLFLGAVFVGGVVVHFLTYDTNPPEVTVKPRAAEPRSKGAE